MKLKTDLEIDAQAMLPAIILYSNDAIISKNVDGVITSWNPAAEKLFQYTSDEAVGQNISLIIPDELMYEEKEIISKIRRGEAPGHFETVRCRKDKTKIDVSLTISPLKDKNGRVIGASKIARDITGQKENERKQSLLAAIVDSSDDAIISKDLNGIILTWNRGAEEIFEYKANEAIGNHISLIIPPEKLQEEAEIIESIKKGKKVNHIDTIRVSKSKKEIHVSVTISPVMNKSGKIIGASKVARDISEKVKMEQEQEYITNELRALNVYKDDFMAMASHELKTPITVINANLQVLRELVKSSDLFAFVNKSLNQVNKLNLLINDLFDVSKMQQGVLQLNKKQFNYNIFLKATIENIQRAYPQNEIILENLAQEALVYGDELRIEQVISNLLINAIKYSPKIKTVWVKCKIKDELIVTEVRDEGLGISREEFEKIFERFYRAKGASATYSGSGIGLYIASEIIKRHNGNIWVESNGSGSQFSFTLPVVKVPVH